MSEQQLLKACIQYLRLRGCYCQRVQAGLIRQVIGKQVRWIHLADKGCPDILAAIPCKDLRHQISNKNAPLARFCGIEVKASASAIKSWHRANKKAQNMKPISKPEETSVAQNYHKELIEKAGGIYALICSLEELEKLINKI